jgi:hypothetical protein
LQLHIHTIKKNMGLTLHYTAKLRNRTHLQPMVEEVADICQSMDWKYRLVEISMEGEADHFPLEPGESTSEFKEINLNGISFTPPDCETVCLSFSDAGYTCSEMNVMASDMLANYEPSFIYSIHTKTQYAGVDTHIAIVKLLKYLEKKYLIFENGHDEGNYWETMDKQELEKNFGNNTELIERVKGILMGEDFSDEKTPDALLSKIEEVLKRRLGAEEEGI